MARKGLDVLLLDKSAFPRDKTCGDGLSPRALDVLLDMGVFDEIRSKSWQVNELRISSPGGWAITAPVPLKNGLPGNAFVTPRLILDEAIRARAVASGATFFDRLHVTDIQTEAHTVRVIAAHRGQRVSLHGRMAVLATGASSGLLKHLGLMATEPQMMIAARAYYADIQALPVPIHFYFDGVPLPGYGWVFPLSETSANIGAGFLRLSKRVDRRPKNARAAFDGFIGHAPIHRLLAGARREGPVKGYPLRVDFLNAPTYGARLLLVGEAAGLVNPLTGEGVDYALETGRLAARHIAEMFAAGDFSRRELALYDAALQERYQRLFRFCVLVRDLLMKPVLMDAVVGLARVRPDLKMALIKIALGYEHAPRQFTIGRVIRALLKGYRISTPSAP